mgnify:FL=1
MTSWPRPSPDCPRSPAGVGISLVDIATAHAATLETLIARGVTGEGADIRVSMFDVLAGWLTVPLLNHESGKSPGRIGLAHPSVSPYGVFATRDGRRILISIQSEREWMKFCTVFLGDPALAANERFPSNVGRMRNRATPAALVAAAFARLGEAVDLLTRADAAFASVNDMAALSAHPHLRRIRVDMPAGPVAFPAPIVIGETRDCGQAPAIGEPWAIEQRQAS